MTDCSALPVDETASSSSSSVSGAPPPPPPPEARAATRAIVGPGRRRAPHLRGDGAGSRPTRGMTAEGPSAGRAAAWGMSSRIAVVRVRERESAPCVRALLLRALSQTPAVPCPVPVYLQLWARISRFDRLSTSPVRDLRLAVHLKLRDVAAGNDGDVGASTRVIAARHVQLALEDADADATIARLLERELHVCLLYTSPSPRDQRGSRMPSSA